MAISDSLIELELEYPLLRKARVDLLSGRLKSGYTHTNGGSQSVTYNMVNMAALDARIRVLKEELGAARGEVHYGPVYWS